MIPAMQRGLAFPVALVLFLAAAESAAQEDAQVWHQGVAGDEIVLRLLWPTDPFEIVELEPWETLAAAKGRVPVLRGRPQDHGKPHDLVLRLPRFAAGRDRLYRGFVHRDPQGHVQAQDVTAFASSPAPAAAAEPIVWPKSKKGITCPVDRADVQALGAAQAAINVQLTSAFLPAGAAAPAPGLALEVDGVPLAFAPAWVARVDQEVKDLTARGVHVLAIVTCTIPAGAGPSHPLVHPRCDLQRAPNRLTAFRVTDRIGTAHFVGFLRFLARRYSLPGAPHGRIAGYVIGNEIDAHWEWHNMGEARLDAVAAQHARELWLASLTVRSVHPGLRVFTSLTHAWDAPHVLAPGRAVPGRALLQALRRQPRCSRVAWDVAFHPYPENLFEPRFWRDRLAFFAQDAPVVTFRNLEVLLHELGVDPLGRRDPMDRRVILSEQGFHCPDGAGGEDLQAAAYALAWQRVAGCARIDAFLLHRHVDHRHEGRLRLGLWSADPSASDPSKPQRARRIHAVFRAAGTAAFAEVAAFALPIVGLTSWEAARWRTEVPPERAPEWHPSHHEPDCDPLLPALADAELTDVHAIEARYVAHEGRLLRGLLLHPGTSGRPARAAVPLLSSARPFRVRFAIARLGDGGDGVRFAVAVDGVELWAQDATSAQPQAVEVTVPAAVTPTGVATRVLEFRVGARGDNRWDHAVWLAPRVVRE